MHRGQLAVNVAAGVDDRVTGAPVTPDTLFRAASPTKGVASTVAHVLAEDGDLDYDVPIAEAWPEFAARGKDKVTVRHVLCHTAGVPGLPPDLTPAQLCDWEQMCDLLADAELWWEPGTRFGYHDYTFGFLLGETLRRLTGRTISGLLRADNRSAEGGRPGALRGTRAAPTPRGPPGRLLSSDSTGA